MNAIALTFHETNFDVVDQSGQPWLRGFQIGSALGYRNPRADMAKLYERNADEFTDSMTALVELDTEGGKQKVRIFSLRGCHLLGMLSRTKIAKEFRKWVLDVLERHTQPRYGLLDLPEPPTITKSQAGQLFALVSIKSSSSGKPRAYYWSRFQNHFKLASYKDTLAERFDEAKTYLENLEGANALLEVTPLELDALVEQRMKAKEGELLEKSATLTGQDSFTLSLAPLRSHRPRRWLVTQSHDSMLSARQLEDNQEIMTPEQSAKQLASNGYIVAAKNEVGVAKLVMDYIPAHYLPVLIETAGKRLKAIRDR